MRNLPKGMLPDHNNQVYYDTESKKFYMLTWEDRGTHDYPTRYYINRL